MESKRHQAHLGTRGSACTVEAQDDQAPTDARKGAGGPRGHTVDGRTSVVDATLQLYTRRFASLSAAVQDPMLVTLTPTQEQP